MSVVHTETVLKMLLFTQRRASVLWLGNCSSDKHDNINVKQRDGREFTTSKRNIVIDIFNSFSVASSRFNKI